MLLLILSLALAQPQSINAEPPPADVRKELEALGTTIKQLSARIDKLEGLITGEDLVGTYVIHVLEISGNRGGGNRVSIGNKSHNGTLRLNADGTFDMLLTIGGFGIDWEVFGENPVQRVQLDFSLVGGSVRDSGTWTFSDGNRLLMTFSSKPIAFTVTGGGRVFVNRQNSPSDNAEMIMIIRCDVSPDACAGVFPP